MKHNGQQNDGRSHKNDYFFSTNSFVPTPLVIKKYVSNYVYILVDLRLI